MCARFLFPLCAPGAFRKFCAALNVEGLRHRAAKLKIDLRNHNPGGVFALQKRILLVVTLVIVSFATPHAQQVANPNFNPQIGKPEFPADRGPVVMLDEAHFNFHTVEGRYKPFAELLRRDGYRVLPFRDKFSRDSLKGLQILVIANALAERNQQDWSLPNPSAFTDEEIKAVEQWVRGGGSLMLIADHMPMAGAAEKLGEAFGARWNNGFAMIENARGPMIFNRSDGSLASHPITDGRRADERIDEVTTFTGSAFQVGKDAHPLIVFGSDVISLMPTVAWEFKPDTPRVSVKGWCQGAALKYGKGRVALFGEAAMFSAQLGGANRQPIGMNAPVAKQNYKLLLNTLHWLSGLMRE